MDKNLPLYRLNQNFERLILLIQACALTIITIATGVAIFNEAIVMISTRSMGLANLLLLFLFVEILAMVKQYALGQKELKLRTPMVITIVAVARYLIINMEHMESLWIVLCSVAILILTIALWITRYIRGLHHDDDDTHESA